jgi:elongation factor 1-gamma
MSLKLLTYPGGTRAAKALIAAKYGGVNVEVPPFNMGVDNKSPDFLKKNPNGKVPVLETPEGSVWESNAIARYVARVGKASAQLLGHNAYENALVDQWIDFSVGEIGLPASAWVFPILGFIPNNPEATQKAKGDIRKVLGILNEHFQTRTFIVHERVSLADIVVACTLTELYKTVLDPGFRKQFANVNRWFQTVVNQAEVKAVLGEVHLCEKMQVAKEAPAAAPAAAEPKQEKKPKEPKPQQPKQEKKPKKEEKEDDEEEEHEEKPKTKNPLDSLPPSTFVIDEWKRTYSNNDTKTVAIPWLYEHFDAQGWSIWHCEYKYSSELKQAFMVSNLVSGMLQRLDKLRKYGFGTMLIFGQEPPITISGLWLVRGAEIPAELKEVDDFELYNWTKLDITNAEHKKTIEEYLHWEGDFGGKGKPADGKVFR